MNRTEFRRSVILIGPLVVAIIALGVVLHFGEPAQRWNVDYSATSSIR